jgi:hypothetical protein
MLFLRGDAITQACTLLINQSRHLFGGAQEETAGRVSEQCNDSASKSSEDGPLLDEIKESSRDYPKQLSDLYQKCKRAYEVVVHADEMGQLDRPSGMNSIPSSPYPNSSITTPRSAHATPGVVVNSMPPPPPSLGGSGGSNIHRRNFSGTTSAPLNANRLQFRRKPGDVSGAHATPKLQRANSNVADTTSKPSAAAQSNPNPPEAVLNFLKKLNSSCASDDTASGSQIGAQPSGVVPAQTISRDKKRKATSPPPNPPSTQAKRPPPPPPPSATPSQTLNAAASDAKSSSPPSPERRSRRAASKRTTPTEHTTKLHGVGESVLVNDNGTWYAAIVKDVDYVNDESVTYEVEFDNGEIRSGVLPVNIRDNEDD